MRYLYCILGCICCMACQDAYHTEYERTLLLNDIYQQNYRASEQGADQIMYVMNRYATYEYESFVNFWSSILESVEPVIDSFNNVLDTYDNSLFYYDTGTKGWLSDNSSTDAIYTDHLWKQTAPVQQLMIDESRRDSIHKMYKDVYALAFDTVVSKLEIYQKATIYDTLEQRWIEDYQQQMKALLPFYPNHVEEEFSFRGQNVLEARVAIYKAKSDMQEVRYAMYIGLMEIYNAVHRRRYNVHLNTNENTFAAITTIESQTNDSIKLSIHPYKKVTLDSANYRITINGDFVRDISSPQVLHHRFQVKKGGRYFYTRLELIAQNKGISMVEHAEYRYDIIE